MINTRTVTVTHGADGVTRIVAKDGCHDTLTDAIANVKAVLDLSKGKRQRLLVDTRKLADQDRAARNYYQGTLFADTSLAVAIVVGSPLQRLFGNFFLGLKLKTPVRLFNDVASAEHWLMTFIAPVH